MKSSGRPLVWFNGALSTIELSLVYFFIRDVWQHDVYNISAEVLVFLFMGIFWISTLVAVLEKEG